MMKELQGLELCVEQMRHELRHISILLQDIKENTTPQELIEAITASGAGRTSCKPEHKMEDNVIYCPCSHCGQLREAGAMEKRSLCDSCVWYPYYCTGHDGTEDCNATHCLAYKPTSASPLGRTAGALNEHIWSQCPHCGQSHEVGKLYVR